MRLIDLENLLVDVDGCWRMQTPLTQDMWAMLSRLVDAEIERVKTQPCEWCEGDATLLELDEFVSLEGFYLIVDGRGARLMCSDYMDDYEWELDIKYCPNCGRKLDDV